MSDELLLLDPVTDEEGNALSDEDVIDAAERAEKVLFEYGGMRFMVWVRKSQVPTRLWGRVTTIQGKIAFKAGFKAGDNPGDMDPSDERLGKMLELMNESASLDEARADVALAATARDEFGKLLTNVPQLRELPVAITLCGSKEVLELGELGEAYIKAVLDHLHPTSTPGEAEAETTNPASEVAPLTSLSSTNPENSPATG